MICKCWFLCGPIPSNIRVVLVRLKSIGRCCGTLGWWNSPPVVKLAPIFIGKIYWRGWQLIQFKGTGVTTILDQRLLTSIHHKKSWRITGYGGELMVIIKNWRSPPETTRINRWWCHQLRPEETAAEVNDVLVIRRPPGYTMSGPKLELTGILWAAKFMDDRQWQGKFDREWYSY